MKEKPLQSVVIRLDCALGKAALTLAGESPVPEDAASATDPIRVMWARP